MSKLQKGSLEMVVAWILVGVIFGLLVGLTILMNSFRCENRWALSGMESNYRPLQGCLVKLPDLRWVPDDRFREMEE